MVVRMRHTRSHTANRRSHHALESRSLALCGNCGAKRPKHMVCPACGKYKGRDVVDVIGQATRKDERKKQREKASGK